MALITDKTDSLIAEAAEDVVSELYKAMAKFDSMNSPHEGHSVIREEFEEMWEEVRANRHDLAIKECIQVGAMCLRYLVDMRAKGYV
jgi:hypothetical protein